MSVYSGKCDCYDTLVQIHGYTEDELKNNVVIYVGDNKESLHIESAKDLIPYYPYLISAAYFDNENRKSVIRLTPESFVDREEREILTFYLKQILRIYNRCKNKKSKFSVRNVVKEVCWNGWNKNQITEIANRVKENGDKATIEGIHLNGHEYDRKRLVEEMINNGLNPADHGYGRFVND